MMKIYTGIFLLVFAAEGFAEFAAVDEGDRSTTMMPLRLEERRKKENFQRETEPGKHKEEEVQPSETLNRSDSSADKSKIDPDKSKLFLSGRNETVASPGSGMRTLNPEYMKVKVFYEDPKTSWWEQILHNLHEWLKPHG